MIKFVRIWFFVALIACSVSNVNASLVTREVKNILLINSYHQGYAWTDSLTSGVIDGFKPNQEFNLFIENLNSKQFGNLNFEVEKEYLLKRYSGIKLDGLIVSDNDALDFVFRYDKKFFPDVPVIFSGISNPDDYQLEGSRYYGCKEIGSTEGVVDFVRNLLPDSKRLLIITDLTTTGLIYRKEFVRQAQKYDDFKVLFPEIIDLDTIYQMASSEKEYDAIYYIGISRDKNGQLVDPMPLVKEICLRSKVPVFTNDPIYNGIGVVGGLFQSGSQHGMDAANLLISLLNSESKDTIKHVYTAMRETFFDRKLLDKFVIPLQKLPTKAIVINQKVLFSKENFSYLLSILVLLSFIIVVLTVVNRRQKNLQKRIVSQLKEIETQKLELEGTHDQLRRMNLELESANDRLKDSNVSLLEAKKKAEESDNLKSAFLANVSHEIRTPLNSIVGFSSLLIEPDLSEETRLMYAGMIESNTESLLVLIDEIIDLSKIEAQQLTIKMQDFSIDALMVELFAIFNHGHKNLSVELRTNRTDPDKQLFVFSDRVRVKQVFVNLLTNALKFTDSGFVEMGYSLLENNEVVLYVKDTGIGIRKEHHDAIFHRFRKLNENSGKVYRGTGLGLAITQKLVELLGGKIWIESELGKGSSFQFTLTNCMLREIRN